MMNETKKAIQTAFIKVYSHKPYEKISIKEVCLEAPAARTTFYEYYENLSDLKSEIEDTLIEGILKLDDKMKAHDRKSWDLEEYFSSVLAYIKENWEINYAFLVKQPNYQYMEKWKSAIKHHFCCRFPEKINVPNYQVITEVIASGIMGAYIYWMKHPDKVDSDKISEISVKALQSLTEIL